jgi:hypothetical protein
VKLRVSRDKSRVEAAEAAQQRRGRAPEKPRLTIQFYNVRWTW